jgi:hypothetical protein
MVIFSIYEFHLFLEIDRDHGKLRLNVITLGSSREGGNYVSDKKFRLGYCYYNGITGYKRL